jgi:hypothetical protein
MNSPQACPICFAGPDLPCRMGKGAKAGIHAARLTMEHGAWTRVYDGKHRELSLAKRFDLAPYRRVA